MKMIYNDDNTLLYAAGEIINEINMNDGLIDILSSCTLESHDYAYTVDLNVDGSRIDSHNIIWINY